MRISDWSSDVCSSDLKTDLAQPLFRGALINGRAASQRFSNDWFDRVPLLAATPRIISVKLPNGERRPADQREEALLAPPPNPVRSAERRVGKGCVSTCRSRWWRYN